MPGSIRINPNKLSMRRTRFRKKAGAIAWDKAGGSSDAFESYIDAKLPQACKAANSIETFRNLHPHEIAEMDLLNLGRYPGRARGVKDASDVKFQQKRDAALAKYNRLKAKFDAENDHRTSDSDTDTSEEVVKGESNRGLSVDDDLNGASLAASPGGKELNGTGYQSSANFTSTYNAGEQCYQSFGESHEDSNSGHKNASDDDEEHQVRHSTNSGDSSGNDDRSHKGDEASEEEESKEEDGGREEQSRDNEESTSPQSVEASDSEEGNFLYEDPATEAESELIQHLLQPTREQFEGLVGIAPPTTDQERSYIYQWGDIATAWREYWDFHEAEGQPDLLIGLTVFTADTVEWNMPSEEIRPSGLELGDLAGLDKRVFAERALRNQS